MNESEAAILMLEHNREAWLEVWNDKNIGDYRRDIALINLDKIDAYINKYFGKQRWMTIITLIKEGKS